jgi:chaperone required for assembly of F1-ATPase
MSNPISRHDPDAVPSRRSDQLGFRPKRFWKASAIEAIDGGLAILLDGRSVKTPGGAAMIVPNRKLAREIQAEWDAVTDHVAFEAMPLTRLAFTAVDRMPHVIDDTVAEVLRYAETDLLAYPSDYPQALIEREAEAWRPWLDWAAGEGLVFVQNDTLIHKPQPAATLVRLEANVRAMTAFEQAGLMSAVPLFGSVVLALALHSGRIGGAEAFAASRIGENFQAETWGRDEEAIARAKNMEKQSVSLEKWFSGLRDSDGNS